MASLSLSKGCMQMEKYGKRLCELLKEQQEPFLLDEYLIQNGYKKTRATKQYCHQIKSPIFSCCSSLSVCKRFLKRKSRTGGVGALRCALNKIVKQKLINKVVNWGCGKRMEFKKLEKFFERESEEMEMSDGEEEWRGLEESRQLSPVSVFELHSDNEDSSSPILNDNISEYEKPSTSDKCEEEFEEMNWEPQEILRPKTNQKKIEEQVFHAWEKIAGEIAKIPELIESDFTKSKREWCQFNQDAKLIGGVIETLIYEEMSKEVVLDLLDSHCTL